MNCSNVRISLDIHKNCSGAVVCAKRGDVGRRIHISLTDGCIPYRIGADCRAVFTAEKPDKNVIYNDCIIQGDTIIYDMTEQTTAVVGRTDCEIKLYGADGKLITSPSFSLIISDTVCDDGDEVESSSEFSALTAAMAEVEELKKNGLRGEPGEQGPQGPAGPPGPKGESSDFSISIFPAGDGYASDETMADIQAAEEAGRTIYCMMETDAQQWIYLPKVKEQDGARYFSAVCDGVEWLVTIALDGDGKTVVNVTQRSVLTDEQAQSAINAYLEVNPITGATFEKHNGNLWDGNIHAVPVEGGTVFTEHDGDYYRTIVFKAKANTNYIITAPNIVIDDGFGQANGGGICTQVPVGTASETSPVTYTVWKPSNGGLGRYISVKTNDNFKNDTAYLIWKFGRNDDLTGAVVFEGTDPADYVNVGEYAPENGSVTSPDLALDERNLSASVNDKLNKGGTAVQPEDFQTSPYKFETLLGGQVYSCPEMYRFSIGDVQKLFNTARICQADASRLKLSKHYAHIPTLTVIGDKAYVAAFENKVNTVDTVVHGTIEMYIVDLVSWTLTEQVSIAIPGLACGGDTLKYGGIDPNVLNINDTTLRIIFATQLSDGINCVCYRDYNISDGSLSDISLCQISDGTITHDFNVSGVKAVCGSFSAANPMLNIDTQYATYNGEHYIGLGVDAEYKNIPILKTTDFITFTHWATPTVEGNSAHYECACVVAKKPQGHYVLYTATRQTRDVKKMLITEVSLTDGSVLSSTWIPDGNARPLWYYNNALYLFHIQNEERNISTITNVSTSATRNSLIGSVADTFVMVYPSLAEYGDGLVVSYMRAGELCISKIPKIPVYTHEQVIPMLNKFLDYFTCE